MQQPLHGSSLFKVHERIRALERHTTPEELLKRVVLFAVKVGERKMKQASRADELLVLRQGGIATTAQARIKYPEEFLHTLLH
jgi:hypothetical protein